MTTLRGVLLLALALSGCAGIIEPPRACTYRTLDYCGTAGPLLPEPS